MRWSLGVLLTAAALGFSASAIAGSGNTLRIIQESPNGGSAGNSLSVDQSEANNSLVLGPTAAMTSDLQGGTLTIRDLTPGTDSPDRSAIQRGANNIATVMITGDTGQLQLYQDNGEATKSRGNIAKAVIDGGLGAVLQFGDHNQATLDVDLGGAGLIAQKGNNNWGKLAVGAAGTGALIQNGNGNSYMLSVDPGTRTIVTQTGDGMTTPDNSVLRVYSSNPGTIIINQTGFNSLSGF